MNRGAFALSFCLLLAAAVVSGCWQAAAPNVSDPAATAETGSEEPSEVDLAVLRYDTGDIATWPDYQFPLEHTFDCPEVPPEIIGPFSAEDIPTTEE